MAHRQVYNAIAVDPNADEKSFVRICPEFSYELGGFSTSVNSEE